MIARISDDRYILEQENEKSVGMGVFIDIYPFDGLGMTKEEALKFGRKGDIISSLCYQATRNHYAVETTTSLIRKIIKYPVFVVSKLIGKDFFQDKLEKMAGVKSFDNSNYVGCIVWLSGGEKDIFKREWFDQTVLMPFDKYMFRVPERYDEVLKVTYNDYMTLPPEEDRKVVHVIDAYYKEP